MCTSPAAVLCYKQPTDRKWSTRYVGSVMPDELIHSPLVMDELALRAKGFETKLDVVPCQQCFECRMQRSRMWADRCSIEAEQYPDQGSVCRNWFVTLTYDNDHLTDLWNDDGTAIGLHNPNKDYLRIARDNSYAEEANLILFTKYSQGLISADEVFGLYHPTDILPKVVKDHLQIFNDSVRKCFSRLGHNGIRFFACGEYGDQNMRPHYHEIMFNMPIDLNDVDRCVPFGANPLGHKYYRFPFLEKIWKKGFVIVAPASWESMAYTARYIVKKQNGDNGIALYQDNGIKPPFVRSSRRSGIGMQGYKGVSTYFDFDDDQTAFAVDKITGEFYDESLPINYHLNDKVYFKHAVHGQAAFNVPRAYDKVFETEHPYLMDIVKRLRKERSQLLHDTKSSVIGLSDRELFDIRATCSDHSISGKQRNFIKDFL